MPTILTRLSQASRALGFEAIGVARALPYPDAGRFLSWLEAGHLADMAWLARDPERRTDPRRVLDGCKSVVMVFSGYASAPLPVRPRDGLRGRMARYALGPDYHGALLARLRQLAESLEDPDARCYVDTGPVLERSAARAAGLGWVGKNANLLVPQVGSYGFLGAILTRQDLEPTPPVTVSCGSCSRCIPACPTGAIVGPGQVDARRCISYLTIESRGIVPRDLRPLMQDWVFGCDACQEPCPWNSGAERVPRLSPPDPAAAGQVESLYPQLADLVALSPEGFASRFRGSPLKRAKRAGLARNAAIALGNSGDPAAVEPLREALRHDSALVRLHAAWALGRLGDRAGLRGALRTEEDPDTRAEIILALGDAT